MNYDNTHAVLPPAANKDCIFYAGIFFVSMSILVFQIALTRVFAILMWYHFAYLIISLALLGFGASGTMLTILKLGEKSEKVINRILTRYSWCLGISILISFFLVTRIVIDSFMIWKSLKDLLGLLVILILLFIPFFAGGMTIGLCLSRYPKNVGRLYSFDLIGAAIGAIICPLFLAKLGLAATVMIAAMLALLGAMTFSFGTNRSLNISTLVCLIVVFIMGTGFSGGVSIIPPLSWDIPFAPNKTAAIGFPGGKSAKKISSAIAQVDVSAPAKGPMSMGGEFGVLDKQIVVNRNVTQDGTAPTFLFEDASDLSKFPSLDDTQAATAYIAFNSRGLQKPDVMVIGVGGGIDVMIALFHNAASVTAVEINKAMIQMVTDDFADFIGNLFNNPKVFLINEDGRSYLERTDQKYDIIQLSGVDTFTALSTGAYTLSESYLYTLEAVKKMYKSLKPGGYINYSRFLIAENPRETIRLANIAYTALKELGISEPWKNIAIFQGNVWASTMIRKGPFGRIEIEQLKQFAEAEKFKGLVFHPFQSGTDEKDTDFRMRKKFETLLLGSDSERNTFIKKYYFDLSPSTDDKPFFFNYFKLSNIFNHTKNFGFLGEYLPGFPVGHMILSSSLVIIIILASMLILLPLKFLPKYKRGSQIKLRTFTYFSSLGIGFMLIEVCMMQKLILFLGHPVYSMSVVLGGLLAFSGLGALFSTKIFSPNRQTMNKLIMAISLLSIFNAFILMHILQPMQGFSLFHRVIISLIVIAPTAFVIGMPFPLGIRMLENVSKELIPWGWGINGFLSVLSSIIATMIAMITGFTWVLIIAGVVYIIGLSFAPVVTTPLLDEQ